MPPVLTVANEYMCNYSWTSSAQYMSFQPASDTFSLAIWRLYLFESIYIYAQVYVLHNYICVVLHVVYALQSLSLYGKILRQLNEFIVNRSRTNKNNESSQNNYNKLAFSIYNYAQLKNLQNDNIIRCTNGGCLLCV